MSSASSPEEQRSSRLSAPGAKPRTEDGLPAHLASRADLPEFTKVVDLHEEFTSSEDDLNEKMAVIVLKKGKASLTHKGDVWVVATAGFRSGLSYHSIKTQVGRKYKVVHQASIDAMLLRAVHEIAAKGDQQFEEDSGDGVQSKTKMMEYYESLVADALAENVSDIHIERKRGGAVIRMRKHGQLIDYSDLGAKDCTDLCAVIYQVLAENKEVTFNSREYQPASINTFISGEEVMLRYQSLPTYPDGFDVVLRVLPLGGDDADDFVDLDKLGYTPGQVRDLMEAANRPVGAVIIAGVTGSGKSTTLKNLLMMINSARGYHCKIYTIEDPPEYRIPRVSQIPVIRSKASKNDKSAISPFYQPLIATMRADPDVLMIGEIRDSHTGDGLKKATQSGHQVLTTVHASSALGIIERLSDFGISPSVMGNHEFLSGLIYQKLVPLLCQNCAVLMSSRINSSGCSSSELQLHKRLVDVLGEGNVENVKLRGPGCEKCSTMKVVGRTVCAEVILPDFQMLKLFRTQKMIEAYEYWRSLSDNNALSNDMRGKTALEHALTKVHAGLVSPEDVETLFGRVDGARKMLDQMRADREAEALARAERSRLERSLD